MPAPLLETPSGPPIHTVQFSRGIGTRLYDSGIEALWYISATAGDQFYLSWDSISRVRRVRYGDPFETADDPMISWGTGLYLEGPRGEFLILRYDERGFARAEEIIRERLAPRWGQVFTNDEVVAVAPPIDSYAPSGNQLHPDMVFVPEPRKAPRGALVATEPKSLLFDRRRRMLSTTILIAGVAFGSLSLAPLLLAFASEMPALLVQIGVPAFLLVGGMALVAVAILLRRRQGLGPIVLYERGILLPKEVGGARERFVPFEQVARAEYVADDRRGRAVRLTTLEWLEPIVLPLEFPHLVATLESRGHSIVG